MAKGTTTSSLINNTSNSTNNSISSSISNTTTTNADEEYIDYSCSTPLERFSRDIETILRKWHVHDNDRHVSSSSLSFGSTYNKSKEEGRNMEEEEECLRTPPRNRNNNNNNNNNNNHSISSKNSSTVSCTLGYPPPRYTSTSSTKQSSTTGLHVSRNFSASSVVVVGGPDSTPISLKNNSILLASPCSTASIRSSSFSSTNATTTTATIATVPKNGHNTNNIRCLRQRTVTFYPTPNPQALSFLLQHSTDKVDPALHRGIPLLLTLWDSPPAASNNNNTTIPTSTNRQHLPWSLQHIATTTATTIYTNPLDLSSLLAIGQHITLTPLPTNTSYSDHHHNVIEAIIQLYYLPSLTTAVNIALSNAACAIPAFVLGTYYDPLTTTTTTTTTQKIVTNLLQQQQQLLQQSYYLSSTTATHFSSTSSVCTTITSKQKNTNSSILNQQQQYAKLLPIPPWLLLGSNMSIHTFPHHHEPLCGPSTATNTTAVVGHCLPVDCCSFPTSLQTTNNNHSNTSSPRGMFRIQVLSKDAIPEPLSYYSNCVAATSFLEKHILPSQKLVVSSITYTFEWDKNKKYYNYYNKNSQELNDDSFLLQSHRTKRDEINYYMQDDPFFEAPSNTFSYTSWRAGSLRRLSVMSGNTYQDINNNNNSGDKEMNQNNKGVSSILRLIHTYEILAGTNKVSILRNLDDCTIYNQVQKSLQPFSATILEKNYRAYDLEEDGEFLIGPTCDPIERILLHLNWTEPPAERVIFSLPKSISVQCSWDKFTQRPVVINPLSAHIRYVFSSYIFAVSTFTPCTTRDDWISGLATTATTTSLLYDEYFRPYIGTTTHKLVMAMKAMWMEQLLTGNNEAQAPPSSSFFSDYRRILKNVGGIVQHGGLWSEDQSLDTVETPTSSLLPYGSPFGRILSLLCFYMSRQSDPRMMMVAWNAFVEELKLLWEKRKMVPNTGFTCNKNGEHSQPKKDGANDKGRSAKMPSYYCRRHGTSCGDCRTDVDRESSVLDQHLQFFNVGVAFALEAENVIPVQDIPLSTKKKRGKHEFKPIVEDSIIPRAVVLTPLNALKNGESKYFRSPGDGELQYPWEADKVIKKSFWCCSQNQRKRMPLLFNCNGFRKYATSTSCAKTEESTFKRDAKSSQFGKRSLSHQDIMSTQEDKIIATSEFSPTRSFSPMSDMSQLRADKDVSDKNSDESFSSEMEIEGDRLQKPVRRGARFPVVSLFLSNGNQIYEPYLQNKSPVTSHSLLHRRFLAAMEFRISNGDAADANIKIRKFFQYPILRSDMQAFKAANPGCIFNDFVRWYGSPAEPLETLNNQDNGDITAMEGNICVFDEEQLFENALRRHFSRGPKHSDNSIQSKLSADSVMELESFWKQIWEDAKPVTAFEQDLKLFDAVQEVEKVIHSLENLSPIQLMNYVLEINFTTAYELLYVRAGDALKVKFIEMMLSRLAEKTRTAILQLKEDSFFFTLGLEHPRSSSYLTGEKILLPITLKTCESLCNAIGEVELILSRASSLLHKFPDQYDLVHHLLTLGAGEEFQLTMNDREAQLSTFQSIQEGILGLLRDPSEMLEESSSNSEEAVNLLDATLPLPVSREFVLCNSNDSQPCRLLAQIRGGPNEAEDHVCILAMSRCFQ